MELGRARRWMTSAPGGWYVAAAAVAAVLGLAASTGGERSLPPRSAANSEAPASPTTVEPASKATLHSPTTLAPTTTTTTPPDTTTTTLPGATTTTQDRTPVYDANGLPQVTASPPQGRVGATIHVDGYGFTDAHWMDAGSALWLSGTGEDPGCLVYAEAEHSIRVTADGRLHGDFVVPSRGGCRQGGVSEFGLSPGTYAIVYQCTVCTIGTFEVTGSGPSPSAECTTVGFTPNSDDVASSIVATGLSCDEAEAFVRKIGPSVGPFGPARIELDGFECVLTRTDDVELAHGFFECTSGSKKITFVRS